MESLKYCFPNSWVEALALEYAKAHISEAASAEDFARLYISALNEIRDSLKRPASRSDGG